MHDDWVWFGAHPHRRYRRRPDAAGNLWLIRRRKTGLLRVRVDAAAAVVPDEDKRLA
jgi:hypothetical protein